MWSVFLGLLLGWGWADLPHDGFYHPTDFSERAVLAASEAVVAFGRHGTGFLITSDGYILTNHHIARSFGAHGVVHRRRDGRRAAEPLEVHRIATDPKMDIALYRAYTDHPLPVLKLRKRGLVPGEPIFVVSHPNQAPQRVSFGQIRSPTRMVGGVPGVEHDAVTGWGSSGAPILDAQGLVVAIHRAYFSNEHRDGVVGIPITALHGYSWIPQPRTRDY